MVNLSELNEKPFIIYPTFWQYRVIFESKQNAYGVFDEILGKREFSFELSQKSSSGKYQSYSKSLLIAKRTGLTFLKSLKKGLNSCFKLRKIEVKLSLKNGLKFIKSKNFTKKLNFCQI